MSTAKVSARTLADSIRTAVASISTCTSTTTNSLQELLNPLPTTEDQKENVRLKSSRSVTVTATARTKIPPRTKAKAKVAVVEVVEELEQPLLPKEKFVLATDVVNSTLKSLSDALKPQSKSLRRVDSAKSHASTTAAHARNPSSTSQAHAPLSRSSSYSQKPLQERSVTDLTNSPRKKSSLRRSSSYSSYSRSGPAPGIIAVGECARIAFQYLRTSEAAKLAGKGMPALQLESGMLALIGKLLAHGLDGAAIKELRILKRRLETYMGSNEEETGTKSLKRKPATKTPTPQPEETLATLLHFANVDTSSLALPIVVSYQTHVLRAIAASKRPNVINAALGYLAFSQQSSPANLISHLAKSIESVSKLARQLESLAQAILSLCPSVSSSEDTLACNEQLRPSPDVTFQLQSLAFQIRQRWWRLAKHEGDLGKELLEPFAKCLSTFARRSSSLASEKYDLARKEFQEIQDGASIYSHSSSAFAAITRTLSSLAQAASLTDEALQWAESPSPQKAASSSASRSAARLVRCAALSLESKLLQGQDIDIEEPIGEALASLGGSLSGGSNDLDTLFTEVVGLRRIATRVLSATTLLNRSTAPSPSTSLQLLFSLVSACTRFVARYVGKVPDIADAKALIRHGERINMALKVIKGITESVTLASKLSVSSQTVSWDELDTILQSYTSVLLELQGGPDTNDINALKLHHDLQYPLVRVSNIYWAYHIQRKKNGDETKVWLNAMVRSVQILDARSKEEKDAGLLGMKLEKIGEVFETGNRPEDAVTYFLRAIEHHIQSGVLTTAAGLISTTSVQRVLELSDGASIIGRLLRSLHLSFIRHGVRGKDQVAYFDNVNLTDAERGFLLELQLVLFSKHALKTQHWDPALTPSFLEMSNTLLELYSARNFPVRRQRVVILLIRLAVEKPEISPLSRLDPLDQFKVTANGDLGEDSNLAKFQDHIHETLSVQLNLCEPSPSIPKLKGSLLTWQTILDSADSWFSLLDKVDDTTKWITQLEMISDYLAIKGEEYLRIPVLNMIVRILELRDDSDSTQSVLALSKLALQLLELGYSGKAGLNLAKAQSILSNTEATAEARLHWHVAYALLLADASYVYSLFAMEIGRHDDALRYAKHCVTLNRRCWGTIENKSNAKRAPFTGSTDAEMDGLTEGVANLSTSERDVPQAWSMTHESLSGTALWPHVPSIYRGLTHQSQVYAHQGMFQEAVFFADQAEKVASAVGAGSLLLDNITKRVQYWANGGRADKAQDVMALAEPSFSQKHLGLASFHLSSAAIYRATGEIDEEVEAYKNCESLLQVLSQDPFIHQLDRIVNAEDFLADQLSGMHLDVPEKKSVKPARQPRGRRLAAKPPARTARKTPVARSPTPQPSTCEECTPLSQLHGDILRRKATAMLIQNKFTLAVELLEKAEAMQIGQHSALQHHLASFKRLVAQSMKDISTDFTFNTLPESTISFPALGRADRKLSEGARSSLLSPAARRTSVLAASVRGKGAAKEYFGVTLQKARDCLSEIHNMAYQIGANSIVNQVGRALSSVTVLLSAAHCGIIKGSLHPLYVAYWSELPKQHTLLLEQSAIKADKDNPTREELLSWPQFKSKDNPAYASAGQFQREYIDIIPDSWTAVSLSLNEDQDELYITRYHAGQSPFILRLPMARHNSRDMDEEVFGFEDGKRDLAEIIDLSDFSTHSGRDMEAKGAKVEWWTEREALDARLRDLLVNIENIWLGGFRGIFSQHLRQPSLLARFQKSFQNILNRHLPSRQGRGQQKKLNFDPRILELFIGLGDATNEEIDLDEPLMDLVYFVVDILQFNGERNAYDEIDFDAMVIETLDALRAYHSASHKAPTEQTHTILILDKNLHAFPWESLPSLQALSISRLPSLAALRERLLTARASASSSDKEPNPGHHICSSAGGASILNPSGDLTHTQKTIRPHLDGMEGTWNHIIGRAPEEKEFEAALGQKDLLLYFGHGSGAQYIRSRTVKKLYNGQGSANIFPTPPSTNSQNNENANGKAGCATALLFGCSSALVDEHGIYEPSGMLSAYMSAGAPAVLGMLWDVTDKDCDRFAVRTGEIWGLWPELSSAASPSRETGRKEKSGIAGKVRKLVKDVEKARGAGFGRGKGKKADVSTGEEEGAEVVRRRGVGLDEAVRGGREACVLRYLNGAAAVVYGIPVFLE
ncbi:uncharacterized protein BDZ99DRAFT_434896 [Mytilinidion resinicola]|uniref:separase n=1 Tax=Mytilinidion resinicola TaxID=574789 RepID=A0A6A6Z293_9PEZI|nr:uncharacterized protein BDZ99DRAFT_434896 [Mytilinidion resinicola]KAF2814928.1 hypothetical protein BDZ99DRAFT_434896 [Mytilinidion resinicola]